MDLFFFLLSLFVPSFSIVTFAVLSGTWRPNRDVVSLKLEEAGALSEMRAKFAAGYLNI
jgi:hypothetical protein